MGSSLSRPSSPSPPPCPPVRPRCTHVFHSEVHHPIVAVLQHTLSPLTASLLIVAVRMSGQGASLRAWARAYQVLARARWAQRRSAPAPARGAGAAPAPKAAADYSASAHVANSMPGLRVNVMYAWEGPALASDAATLFNANIVSAREAPSSALGAGVGGGTNRALREDSADMHASDSPDALVSQRVGRVAAVGTISLAVATAAALEMSVGHIGGGTMPSPALTGRLSAIYDHPWDSAAVAAHLAESPWSVAQVQAALAWAHSADGLSLPWWGTIVAVTLALRVALAPLNISVVRNALRLKLATPALVALLPRMAPSHPPSEQAAAAETTLAVLREARCHPLKHALTYPLLIPPIILSLFGGILNTSLSEPAMTSEGLLWFTDLVVADPTFVLPILSAGSWLWNVESGAGAYYDCNPALRNGIRTAACLAWPLAATMPSGVLLFWVTSNLFAVVRGYATRPDAVRRLLGIPTRSQIDGLRGLPRAEQ